MVRTLTDQVPSVHETSTQERVASSAQANQSGSANPVPSVFISYSWDDDAHRDWVGTLAERLRADGVNVSIDRWFAVPGDQLPAFMERAIQDNQYVVIICTPRYKRRANAREGGVGYEGDIMTAEVMTRQNHRKFIPVLRNGTTQDAIPTWLSGKYFIDLAGEPYSERNYEDLVRTLLGLREAPPPIGKPLSTISTGATYRPLTQESKVEEFDDIKIVRVVVEDVTEPRNDGTPGCALYSIPFQLSAMPPREWAALFPENWNNPSQFTTMHRPGNASIEGATIILRGTTIEEVERYHRNTLQLSVEETNKQYRQRLLAEEQRQARANAHRKQVDEVSKRIKFD
jgi:TIR domain-containing protein